MIRSARDSWFCALCCDAYNDGSHFYASGLTGLNDPLKQVHHVIRTQRMASSSSSEHHSFTFLHVHTSRHSTLLVTVTTFLLLVSLLRIVWHHFARVSHNVPECIMLFGIESHEVLSFNPEIFFLLLIPPIIFEAGYHLDKSPFLANFWTIVTFAFVGTAVNAALVGTFLWLLRHQLDVDFPFTVAMTFASLISAVDPVAVIAIFEAVHVNRTLNVLVFGESVLNDAVSIVLYRLFVELTSVESVGAEIPFLAVLQFVVVTLGGVCVGIVLALSCAFITKLTSRLAMLEPLVVFTCALLAYGVAEIMDFSGIVAILVCGITMSHYVEQNVSKHSHATIKFSLKIIASTAETLVFLYLGINTVIHFAKGSVQMESDPLFAFNHTVSTQPVLMDAQPLVWHPTLMFYTTLAVIPIRFVTIFALTSIVNRYRIVPISPVNRFVLAYGGLRGAIAFALAFTLDTDIIGADTKSAIISATLVVIWITSVFQGLTIKPLLKVLHVKRDDGNSVSYTTALLSRVCEPVVDGISTLLGTQRPRFLAWMRRVEHCLHPVFVRPLYPSERRLLTILRDSIDVSLQQKIDIVQSHVLLHNDLNVKRVLKEAKHLYIDFLPLEGETDTEEASVALGDELDALDVRLASEQMAPGSLTSVTQQQHLDRALMAQMQHHHQQGHRATLSGDARAAMTAVTRPIGDGRSHQHDLASKFGTHWMPSDDAHGAHQAHGLALFNDHKRTADALRRRSADWHGSGTPIHRVLSRTTQVDGDEEGEEVIMIPAQLVDQFHRSAFPLSPFREDSSE